MFTNSCSQLFEFELFNVVRVNSYLVHITKFLSVYLLFSSYGCLLAFISSYHEIIVRILSEFLAFKFRNFEAAADKSSGQTWQPRTTSGQIWQSQTSMTATDDTTDKQISRMDQRLNRSDFPNDVLDAIDKIQVFIAVQARWKEIRITANEGLFCISKTETMPSPPPASDEESSDDRERILMK